MKNRHEGLIIEVAEIENSIKEKADYVNIREYGVCSVTSVSSDGVLLGREKGKYVTFEFDKIYKIDDKDFDKLTDIISEYLRQYLSLCSEGRIIVVGVGNRNITADSIGPKTIDRIIVTRGLEQTEFIDRSLFSSVCAICSDVFGITGIESAEIIKGLVSVLQPAAVIVIDALATKSVSRLCKTVQISDTSLTPGGGVGNDREKISSDKLGVPVISIGVPTVLEAESIIEKESDLKDFSDELIIIPSRIDDATTSGAKLIAFALNKALHNGLDTNDILKFLY